MRKFLSNLDKIITNASTDISGFTLDTIEIQHKSMVKEMWELQELQVLKFQLV